MGCSFYSFRGSIPTHIKSIYISPVDNHTTEGVASDVMKMQLEDDFISENILKLLPMDNSDSQLNIVLTSLILNRAGLSFVDLVKLQFIVTCGSCTLPLNNPLASAAFDG